MSGLFDTRVQSSTRNAFGEMVHPMAATAADRSGCRERIKVGSRSFFAASLLLPAEIRQGAYALYAFCRISDDLVDEDGGSHDAIAALRRRLALAYNGTPADSPIDRAFSDVVRQYDIPQALPAALIDGLEWDVRGVRCEDLSDLFAYSTCVAASVGGMMTCLMGVRDAETLARAFDLGVAMQLTNIARDVGEDARNGRLYLPRQWMAEAGLDADLWLQAPEFSPQLAKVIARLLDEAEALYCRSDRGIARLPASCRPAIFAARHIYREIGIEVIARQYDSVSFRARVSGRRKLALVGRAVKDATLARISPTQTAPLAETRALVEAAMKTGPLEPFQPYSERLLWAAELFTSLEQRRLS
jgi:phytoene synthase